MIWGIDLYTVAFLYTGTVFGKPLDIAAQVDIEMEAIEKELQVKTQETILQLNQQLQSGNIIEERFTLELEKLEKQTEQQIIQTREQKILAREQYERKQAQQ